MLEKRLIFILSRSPTLLAAWSRLENSPASWILQTKNEPAVLDANVHDHRGFFVGNRKGSQQFLPRELRRYRLVFEEAEELGDLPAKKRRVNRDFDGLRTARRGGRAVSREGLPSWPTPT